MLRKCVMMEQRVNIKFCYKLGKTASETFEMLKQAYGDDTLCRAAVFRWYAKFRNGREEIEDDELS